MTIRLFIIILFLSFLSCEEVTDWEIDSTDQPYLVVEAVLTDEFKQHEILLKGLLDSLNDTSTGLSNAFIEVSRGEEKHLFWENPSKTGSYTSTRAFAIEPGQTYRLKIDWNQQQYEAFARGVKSSPMRNFTFTQHQETDSVLIDNIGVEYSNSEEALYEIIVDWEQILPGDKTKAKLVHYVFNSINIGQLFGPAKEQVIFPRGSLVFIRKYSLDPSYAEYLRSLVIETQWKGGLFEESNGNLPTNLSNNGLGYFAICSVQRDTLIAE